MRPTQYSAGDLTKLLYAKQIATLPELLVALGTPSRRTVFRKLGELAYRTSYSHRGRYYTLDEIARFDEQGLWSHRQIWFSVYGTLLATAAATVESSELGYFVEELDQVLHVGTKDALRQLARDGGLQRERVSGRWLYCALDPGRRRQQLLARRALLAEPGAVGPLPTADLIPEELRAAIVLFFSLLDEKQRRLYAGLESLKSGHGGDVQIAELLGLDAGTVARGRRELVRHDVEVDRVRRRGGGRKPVEKKRPRSSSASTN
jgi:hypothetical protein